MDGYRAQKIALLQEQNALLASLVQKPHLPFGREIYVKLKAKDSVKWFKGFILFDLWSVGKNFDSICVGVIRSFNVSYDDGEQELEAGDEYSWLPVSE